MDESTERFLRLMNEQNLRIAAQQAAAESQIPSDPIRLQRDKERRDKWGQLRAREKPSLRPTRARNVFPYVDPR